MRGYYLFYGIEFASYFFCFNVITALTLCAVDCNVEMNSEVVYTAFCIIWMACVIDIFSSPELYWVSHLSVCLSVWKPLMFLTLNTVIQAGSQLSQGGSEYFFRTTGPISPNFTLASSASLFKLWTVLEWISKCTLTAF